MITLKKLNIEKIVSTQAEADKLIAKGYAVTGGDDAEIYSYSDDDYTPPTDDLLVCPICNKVYKTQDGLNNHMRDRHPQTGGDNNGGKETQNQNGTQGGAQA